MIEVINFFLILDEYLLVVEYTEEGSLHNYLKKNFLSLKWQDKYRLALQLSRAVEYLHEKKIAHKDLHSNSIFIHKNSIRLADSGLSKRIKDGGRTTLKGTIPYTDPRGINIEERSSSASGEEKQIEKYELNEKSDVYSVGVLLWELSSGKKPFADKEHNDILAKEITNGLRESMVEGTPEEYYSLYASKFLR